MSNRLISYYHKSNLAEEIISDLQKFIIENKTLQNVSSLRDRYLKAIISIFNINAQVISAEEKFDDVLFKENLQLALELCRDPTKKRLEIMRSVNKNVSSFGALYLPFEVAEAIYLSELFGVDYKLGPTTEAQFDKIILNYSRQKQRTPYKIIWYSRVPDRTASYLKSDESSIYIGDSIRLIKIKLQDTNYRTWLQDIIKPFNNPSLSLEDNIIEISRNIKQAI